MIYGGTVRCPGMVYREGCSLSSDRNHGRSPGIDDVTRIDDGFRR